MKAMVLFSGGVDSTTALALAVEKYGASEVLALSIYYGQKHKKELEAAQKVVNYYGVAWKQLDLTTIFADSNCSLLANSTEEIPQESYAEQLEKTNGAPVSTYVPFRNGLFPDYSRRSVSYWFRCLSTVRPGYMLTPSFLSDMDLRTYIQNSFRREDFV